MMIMINIMMMTVKTITTIIYWWKGEAINKKIHNKRSINNDGKSNNNKGNDHDINNKNKNNAHKSNINSNY